MNKRLWMLGLALILPACDGGGDGTGAAAGSAGSAGGETTGTGGTAGSGTGGNTTTGTGGSTGSTAPVGDCSVAMPCTAAGESCVFPANSCGSDATGMCKEITCDGTEENHGPICLCDGEVFEFNAECLVWDQSKPIAPADNCANGTFSCGTETCTYNTQFCIVTYAGPEGSTPSYECRNVVDAQTTCLYGISDCGCINLMDLGCPDTSCCYMDGFYQETVTVYLP